MNAKQDPAESPENEIAAGEAPAEASVENGETEQPEGAAAAQAGIETGDVPGNEPVGEPSGEPPIPSFELNKDSGDAPTGGDEQAARIAELELEVAEAKDKMLRAVAEQENVRRRAQKDVENATRRSIKSFASDLLAVADNLRRALDSIDESTRKENPALENMLIGVEMTERELMNAFARHGIQQMQPVGQRFDPNIHEAMFEYDDPDQPAGTVGQVIETGYLIQDQPLRAAKVGVTKGGPKADAPPAADAPEAATSAESAKTDSAAEPGSHIDENL